MKNLICIFLILITVLTTLSACKTNDTKNFSTLTEEEIEDYLQFVENSVETYYNLQFSDNKAFSEAINQIKTQTNDKALLKNEISTALDNIKEMFPDSFAENFKEYMSAKLFCESSATVLANEYTLITSSDFNVEDWKIVDEHLVCKVNCSIAYKTVKYESDDLFTMSKITTQIQVVIENTKTPMFIDWYCAAPSSFGSHIRTYELDLFETENWLNKINKDTLNEKLKDRCTEVFVSFLTVLR